MDDILSIEKTFLKRGVHTARTNDKIDVLRTQSNLCNLNSPLNKELLFNEWKRKKEEKELEFLHQQKMAPQNDMSAKERPIQKA